MHPPSGRKLSPLGQGGRAVLLEDVAAVEVAVLVEVVVERGMDGSELLNRHFPENLRIHGDHMGIVSRR